MEEVKQIDFVKITKLILRNKKYYLYTLPVAFVLSSLLIICVPRYYMYSDNGSRSFCDEWRYFE